MDDLYVKEEVLRVLREAMINEVKKHPDKYEKTFEKLKSKKEES